MIEYLSFDCNEYEKLEVLAINKTAITLLPYPYITVEPIFMTYIHDRYLSQRLRMTKQKSDIIHYWMFNS